ncbi:MAG: deoxyguanosinetriphosphate triphosphohydrolase [Trueperaceae bacterium]|nr:deoxyguanosinetriphosphate triphosphohydrolase [Trueperaceae bacterium]
MLFPRARLESRERDVLAPYACLAADSRGRVHDESESAYRTAFQKDRDRVIHTTAFRRLEYKTQVFVNYQGDHYRTRLTHTLEVAQVAKAVCRALGLNEDLAETIALAHDLGHPPFGHAGERTLDRLAQEAGGFDHNKQSLRIVTRLERRYDAFEGLNLAWETLEGIMKHESEYDLPDTDWEPDKKPSLEAQVVNLADEMTYNAHDLDDGLRAGLLSLPGIAQVSWIARLMDELDIDPNRAAERERYLLNRELLGRSIHDVVHATDAALADAKVGTAADVRAAGVTLARASGDMARDQAELKRYLYANLYRHHRQIRMNRKADRILSEIFAAYLRTPEMLPASWQAAAEARGLVRAVTDYLAGFTDRFAGDEYRRLFDPSSLT